MLKALDSVSMIIFAGIMPSIPEMIKEIYKMHLNVKSWSMTNSHFVGINPCHKLLFALALVEQAQYKIQSIVKDCTKTPSKFLPSFEKPSRVIPVFASSITRFAAVAK